MVQDASHVNDASRLCSGGLTYTPAKVPVLEEPAQEPHPFKLKAGEHTAVGVAAAHATNHPPRGFTAFWADAIPHAEADVLLSDDFLGVGRPRRVRQHRAIVVRVIVVNL